MGLYAPVHTDTPRPATQSTPALWLVLAASPHSVNIFLDCAHRSVFRGCKQTLSLSVLKQNVIRYRGEEDVSDAIKVSIELMNCLEPLMFDIPDFIAVVFNCTQLKKNNLL